jgi:hypothetical protein
MSVTIVSPAAAQDAEQKLKALGSRAGDHEQDVNNAGLSGDRRTSRRINTRIESRLKTRFERFSDPQSDYAKSTDSRADDGTRKR